MLTQDIATAVAYAKRTYFAPDARVAGVLVNADIAPVSFGELHGADRPEGQEFVRFDAVGIDKRNGYDLVQTVDGAAYVIVTYAEHARERGLTHLQAHIAANPAWYATRRAAWTERTN